MPEDDAGSRSARSESVPEGAPHSAGASLRDAAAGAARVGAATLLFALVHSAFASRKAKRTAAQLLGEEKARALYRPFYNLQTVVTLGALWAYARRQPDRELYRVEGPLAAAMLSGQAAALGYFAWTASSVGLAELSGLKNLAGWLAGDEAVREPEAQGPSADEDGRLRIAGPFRWSRHPLNFAPVPLLWLAPRMTSRWAAFNTVATLYFLLGSFHEEARLAEKFGERYAEYQRSGCPFFVPGAGHRASDDAAR